MAENATKMFIDSNTQRPTVKGLVVAGSADLKDQLVDEDKKYFDPRLLSILVTTVDVAQGGVSGLAQAIDLSQESLKNTRFMKQSKMLGKLFEEIAKDTGMVTFGVSETMSALESGVVKTLFVSENLETMRHVLVPAAPNKTSSSSSESQDSSSNIQRSEVIYCAPNVNPLNIVKNKSKSEKTK